MFSARPPLLVSGLMTLLLSGCQPYATAPQSAAAAEENTQTGSSPLYVRFYDDQTQADGRVTLMARDTTLLKAIKSAYPAAPIAADPSVDLDKPISVWAENLTPTAYLAHLSERADAHIWENNQGGIRVASSDQWQFTLPAGSPAALMEQARLIAGQAGARTIVMGPSNHILLATGTPSQLATVKTALNQLSDRIELETRFANL